MILNNANLITQWPQQPLIEGALLAIEGKTIVDFGRMGKLIDRYDDPETYDVGGRLVIPGTIDALARPTRSLRVGSGASAGAYEAALDRESIEMSAIIGLMDALRAGVTSVIALHASPGLIDGSLELVERAFVTVGLRGVASYALGTIDDGRAVKRELDAQIGRSGAVVEPLVALTLTSDMDDAFLRSWTEAAADIDARAIITTGGRDELDATLATHAASPVARLSKLGVLDRLDGLLFAPHRLPVDLDAIAASKSHVLHCPLAEMLMEAPSPELSRLRAAGIDVGFGSGGVGAGVLDGFRLAGSRGCASGLERRSALELAEWGAFSSNAALASKLFGTTVGCIRPGARADLVVLDKVPATPLSAENLPEQLFSALEPARVHTVIVNGAILYHNGSFVGLDEARLRARSREISRQLWERIH